MRNRAAVVAVFAVVVLTVGAGLVALGATGARLTLTPSSASRSAVVRVDGSGFGAGATGRILFDNSSTGMPAYTASSTGTFSVNFTVPATAAVGTHKVSARSSTKKRVVASATLTVVGPTPSPSPAPTPSPVPTASPAPTATAAPTATPAPVTVLAAGDVASCSSSGDEATAALLAANAGTIVIPGDIAYENGSTTDFNNCFDPSWGPFKSRMKPAPGNHEYNTAGAAGYYAYFGSIAGDPAKGYYAFDLGAWRFYSLNSNCAAISGGCAAGGAQEQWLRADLAANPHQCVAAYWHHPRYSSGEHGSSTATQALYQALYDANADLILVGHDHDYERFAPQNAVGGLDTTRGIRQFVVGTGGRSHYATIPITNSEVANSDTFGLLKLTLTASGYSWQFLPEAGHTFTDSGSTACH
jgi:hypothetical protein